MAQRSSRGSSSSSRGSSSSSRGSRKVVVAPVKKSFPWGFAAGVAVLVLAVAAILGYAVVNTGSGFRTAADRVDGTYDALQVVDNPSSNHVEGSVDYPAVATQPPNSGNHNATPQTCQVYDAAIAPEHAVHSMEHGAVWVTYQPDLPADQVQVLTGLVEGNPYRLLSPYPGQASPVSLQAWGRTLAVPSATDPLVTKFLTDYTSGPQTREVGASCEGTTETGPLTASDTAVPMTTAPTPSP